MERTISMMVGKGSLNHNNRTFTAKNVDAERSKCNKVYVKESIKQVYHTLFDKALEAYNSKQTRQIVGLTIIMKKSVQASRRNCSMS